MLTILIAELLTSGGWRDLLEGACLIDIAARTYKTTVWHQWASEVRQMNPIDYLEAWGKFVPLYFKSPAARKWIKEISMHSQSVFSIVKYWGYGIYTGRK